MLPPPAAYVRKPQAEHIAGGVSRMHRRRIGEPPYALLRIRPARPTAHRVTTQPLFLGATLVAVGVLVVSP